MNLEAALAAIAFSVAALCASSAVRAAPAQGSCTFLSAYHPGDGDAARIGQFGNVVRVRGNAFIASRTGWQTLVPGTRLSAGAYVRVGPQSSAVISFGGHQIILAAGTAMSILAESGAACVRVLQADQAGLPKKASGTEGAASGFTPSPIGIGIAALDASVTGVFTLGLVKPVSR